MEHLVTNPLNYFFALLAILLALIWFSKLKWYWHLPVLTPLACLFFLLTPSGANYAVDLSTEDREQRHCEYPQGLVVMEELVRVAQSDRDYGAMSQGTLSRAHQSVEWLERDPERLLVLSGPDADNRNPGAAKVAYNYLLLNGIAAERIIYYPSPPSYFDVAVGLASQLEERDLTLVTSKLDVDRASAVFEAQGFSVCPLVTPYSPLSGHPILMILPSVESVNLTRSVLWELVGVVWYWWTDRI